MDYNYNNNAKESKPISSYLNSTAKIKLNFQRKSSTLN